MSAIVLIGTVLVRLPALRKRAGLTEPIGRYILIAGLLPASSGSILLDGEPVKRLHPRIGAVFQTDLLLFRRTVTGMAS